MVSMLLNHGANPLLGAEDQPPIFHAAAMRADDVISLLISRGGEIDQRGEDDGIALMLAVLL